MFSRLPFAASPLAFACLASLSTAPAAISGTFSETQDFGSNPGNLRMYSYRPARLGEGAPLVVVLHGCNQSAPGYFEHSGWQAEADRGGFALLFPEQQLGPGPIFDPNGRNHPTSCFNFAEVRDSTRDSGEALSIRQMISTAVEDMEIDEDRIFVNGLSAGGGMTAVMLATYPEVFSSGAIIAGLPYRCGTRTATAPEACGISFPFLPSNPAPDRSPEEWGDLVRAAAPAGFTGPWPRVSIWQGDADGTVDPPNARELVEQWTDVHRIDALPDEQRDLGVALRAAYANPEGEILVELYALPGFAHATPIDPDAMGAPCGMSGDPFIRDADICSTSAIAAFFGLGDTASE